MTGTDDVARPLGSFLRARRERVDPVEHGLRTLGPRRTPGLRREEVASLAGISVEYLVRLERGRDRNPSPSVLDALADVLRLDADGRAHLEALAEVRSDPGHDDDPEPSPELLAMMDEWPHPAVLMNRFMDLLAVNAAGSRLHEGIGLEVGDNMTRALFLHPAARTAYPDFEQVAEENVANLRALAGREPAHPRLREIVGELSVASADFARLWARADVRVRTTGSKLVDLPDVGRLTLSWQTFEVSGARGQLLVTYRPVEGTGTTERLARLVDDPTSEARRR